MFLLIGLRVVPLPDSVASIALPERFWFLLSLVILLGYLGHRTMVSPPARKMMRAPGPGPTEPALSEGVEPPAEIASEPVPIRGIAERPVFPAVAARASSADSEISKLITWLDGVAAKLSEWGGGHAEREPAVEEPSAHTTLTSMEVPGSLRAGAWTEHRARSAIQKYLRRRPWTPAADIARALQMEVGLATRVTQNLRDEGVE